ncbi:hypothetical protein VFPPC_18358 [Pochonia chlamydosporia 170]|uniref:DUF3669 domain-containing protein n=1 Tax=Pochonia chlamydosporia 170 TaxID=1380566 RepID=A0A219ARK3_METCM|nr:hypothetical protein VFPPC_18358 [Pochonia chlamydosporia 170]OWT43390.1 hypothetical protein VFPPC_18358 [Pochonia chlamydosporia 170]
MAAVDAMLGRWIRSNGMSSIRDDRPDFARLKFQMITRTFWLYFGHISKLLRAPPPSAPTPLPIQEPVTTTEGLYTMVQKPAVTLKVSNEQEVLQEEYDLHVSIESAFIHVLNYLGGLGSSIILPFIPHYIDFHPEILKSKYSILLPNVENLPAGYAAYAMESIRPFHPHHVRYLVKRHLSPSIQDRALDTLSNSHFVTKVCLGGLTPLSEKWQIGLNDRPAYVDQLYAERVDIAGLSKVMGSTLAVLHWCCGIDAAGVEFVLGCDKKGNIRLWLANFGNCRPFKQTEFDVTTQLVDAVMNNDCCWPRWINLGVFREIWHEFWKGYIEMSLLSCNEHQGKRPNAFLPRLFINELGKTRGPPV